MNFLIYPLAVAFVLGIMVLVHEFGHYAVAKLCGVRVEVFSIGFGKRLWGFRRGDTDYRISLLPLGGDVKMSVENALEARPGDPGEFMSHARWQRFLIAIAGPAMNILLAVVLLTAVYTVHYAHDAYRDQPARIGWVIENSPASRAGLQPGDLITRIENLKDPDWEDALYKVMLSPNQPLDLTVKRGDQELQTRLVPEVFGPNRVGQAGVLPAEPVQVERADENLPAFKAGVRAGDEIVSVDSVPARSIAVVHHALD